MVTYYRLLEVEVLYIPVSKSLSERRAPLGVRDIRPIGKNGLHADGIANLAELSS